MLEFFTSKWKQEKLHTPCKIRMELALPNLGQWSMTFYLPNELKTHMTDEQVGEHLISNQYFFDNVSNASQKYALIAGI